MEGVGARMVEVDDIVAAVGEGMCGMRGTPCLGCCAKKKITEHYFFDVQCLQKTPPQRIQTKMLFIFKEHYFAQTKTLNVFTRNNATLVGNLHAKIFRLWPTETK